MNTDSGAKDEESTLVEEIGKTTTADVFRILSNRRRRYAIIFFLSHDPQPDLRDLAQQIAAWETQKSVNRVTAEERKRVYNAFQQFHLPRMDKAGIIEYDSTRHTIESTEGVSVARPYLEVVPGTSIPWCLYYLAFGGISLIVTTAVVVSDIPIPGTALALVISILLVVSASAHVYLDWRRLSRKENVIEGDRMN